MGSADLLPGLQAIAIHRAARWCWTHGMKWFGRFISHIGRVLTGIEIHPRARSSAGAYLSTTAFGVVIGETAEVGDDCTILPGGDAGRYLSGQGQASSDAGLRCDHRCWCNGSFTVGGMQVGSNAVLLREVPPCATAVGNPARIILKEEHVTPPGDVATRVFSSYGITPDLDDPLIKALQALINHAAAQDQQIRILTEALEKAGVLS